MDKLPLEITSLIISYIPSPLKRDLRLPCHRPLVRPRYPPFLARYAVVSRSWQRAVEDQLFTSIWLDDKDLDQFALIFRSPRRQRLLSEVRLAVNLPAQSEGRRRKLMSKKERALNDACYSRAVRRLFEILHSWQEADRGAGVPLARPINLDIDVRAAFAEEDGLLLSNRPEWQAFHARDENVYVNLQSNGPLPTVLRIGRYSQFRKRMSDVDTLSRIVSAAPNLRSFDVEISMPERRLAESRALQRQGLCSMLESSSLSSLAKFKVVVHDGLLNDHSFSFPDMRDPEMLPWDRLSRALHRLSLSPTMTRFDVSGSLSLSSAIFWPEEIRSDSERYWPMLRNFYINMSPCAPDGQYYMSGTPRDAPCVSMEHRYRSVDVPQLYPHSTNDSDDLDDSDVDSYDPRSPTFSKTVSILEYARQNGLTPCHGWRHEPDPSLFNPLMLAMARAAHFMPKIQQMRFCMGIGRHQIYSEFMDVGERSVNMAEWDILEDEDKYVDKRVWVFAKNSERAFEWQIPKDVLRLCRAFVGPGGYILKVHEDDGIVHSLEEIPV